MKKIRMLIFTALFVGLTGCQTLIDVAGDFGRVALDRAQTISSALALRDGYVELKTQIIANAEQFTPEEQAALESERIVVEDFYAKVIALSRGGNAEQILVKSDEFLTVVLMVRQSVDRAILIIGPKMAQLNPEGAKAAAQFIGNYERFSAELDGLLARNNRAEAVRVAATFLKAAVPVITGLL